MNVLVFPCGSEVGLEIHRAFKGIKNVDLIGASSISDHGEFVYARHYGGLPFVEKDEFVPAINDLIRETKTELVFPAHDSVVLKLAQDHARLRCDVVGSPVETCELVRSKRKTYAHFHDKIRTPVVYDPMEDVSAGHFPLFLKPDVGQGSKGTAVARNAKELCHYLAKDPSLLVLEYLPGEEYTIDCFTNYRGELLYHGARTRTRIINGISVRTRPESGPEFSSLAIKINETIRLNGAWFFQVKRAVDGTLALLEIAPRIAGASALNRVRGVNLPVLSYYNQLRIPVKIDSGLFDVTLERAWSNLYRVALEFGHVYVDFDDCLCIGGKVNPGLVGFLYQCINKGRKIYLLTKCADNVFARLNDLRLGQVFDAVIRLGRLEKKSRHITHPDAIFIDDSYAERSEVHSALGIPVFSVDAVECLLDGRNE